MEQRPVFHVTDPDIPPEALRDPMKPPEQPILVHCLHCHEEYESWRMIWVPFDQEQAERAHVGDMRGFWCCPIEGCSGAGFTVDIWPVDPEYVDPETGEKYCFEDPPMIEGHESDCECVECEMLREEEEVEFEREDAEYQRKIASGEIKPPAPPPPTGTDEDIPF